MQQEIFFGPTPGEGSKGQILNFNYKVNLKDVYTKLCMCFPKLKDTKHIRWNFHSVAWVMPQGWDFGALGVPRGQK